MAEATTKPVWQSWTFWFNIVLAIVAFAQLPEVQALDIIPQSWLAGIAAIGNFLLRFKTKTAIGATKSTA